MQKEYYQAERKESDKCGNAVADEHDMACCGSREGVPGELLPQGHGTETGETVVDDSAAYRLAFIVASRNQQQRSKGRAHEAPEAPDGEVACQGIWGPFCRESPAWVQSTHR